MLFKNAKTFIKLIKKMGADYFMHFFFPLVKVTITIEMHFFKIEYSVLVCMYDWEKNVLEHFSLTLLITQTTIFLIKLLTHLPLHIKFCYRISYIIYYSLCQKVIFRNVFNLQLKNPFVSKFWNSLSHLYGIFD